MKTEIDLKDYTEAILSLNMYVETMPKGYYVSKKTIRQHYRKLGENIPEQYLEKKGSKKTKDTDEE